MYDFDKLKTGDVIVEKLPFDLYSCVVIVKSIGNSKLFYSANYIDSCKPSISDPRLKEIYITKDHFKELSINWADDYHGNSLDFEYIGNIKIDSEIPKCNSLFLLNARDPFWDWMEENMPEKIEEEKDKFYGIDDEIEINNKMQMDDTKFWKMIDHLFPDELDEQYAIKKLTKYPREEIIAFHNTLGKHLEVLEKLPLKNNKYNSDDAFLYTRCFIIAQGLEYYNETLEDRFIEEDLVEDSFEELLEITEEALERANYSYDYQELLELK
ncbi:DUF4240 domain-containing protein [Macrococcus epidermidis]|uniref:DUF4240 domain-containing protein n=1 Tax=Macrococcus epidermidis TaxID=1902580 RepID=UPI0020B7F3B9|nr:DUF4240 domain-containing protein [Macrococcus epidermidis]UTH15077.1 DUF4240 domain-containing protein [Macrococcus epidermidis]